MGSYEKEEEFLDGPNEAAPPEALASIAGSSESSSRLVMVVSTQLVFTANGKVGFSCSD